MQFDAAETRHLLVQVTLSDEASEPAASTELRVHAHGFGEDFETTPPDGDDELPENRPQDQRSAADGGGCDHRGRLRSPPPVTRFGCAGTVMMRHDRRRRSQRLRRQLLAGFAFIGLLIGVVALPLASETDAAWVDSEHGRGTFSAVVVQAPSAIDFSLCRDFGTVPVPPDSQQMVTIRWRWAAPMPGSVTTTWTVGGDAISPTTTGPVDGVYSSTFRAGQLRCSSLNHQHSARTTISLPRRVLRRRKEAHGSRRPKNWHRCAPAGDLRSPAPSLPNHFFHRFRVPSCAGKRWQSGSPRGAIQANSPRTET